MHETEEPETRNPARHPGVSNQSLALARAAEKFAERFLQAQSLRGPKWDHFLRGFLYVTLAAGLPTQPQPNSGSREVPTAGYHPPSWSERGSPCRTAPTAPGPLIRQPTIYHCVCTLYIYKELKRRKLMNTQLLNCQKLNSAHGELDPSLSSPPSP